MSKIAYQKKIQIFFLLLKTAYQKKKKILIYPCQNQNVFLILKKLQELGLILGYVQRKDIAIQIYLRYDMQSLPAINEIFFFPKGRYISFKQIRAFQNDYPVALSFLHTQFGILNLTDCQKKHCGGEFIVTIT